MVSTEPLLGLICVDTWRTPSNLVLLDFDLISKCAVAFAGSFPTVIQERIRESTVGRPYTATLRLLIMELCFTFGVSTRNVSPLLKLVLKELTGVDVTGLPLNHRC